MSEQESARQSEIDALDYEIYKAESLLSSMRSNREILYMEWVEYLESYVVRLEARDGAS